MQEDNKVIQKEKTLLFFRFFEALISVGKKFSGPLGSPHGFLIPVPHC
jgi:hypothetical protein